jgi:signal transduction histidine kinase
MPDVPLDAATRARYLAIVGDETARLERVVGELLDLARLEGGGGTLRIDEVSIAQLFGRVVERHEQACAGAAVSMTTSIGPGAERVTGDRDRLEQAIQNLAGNAMRFAPSGSTIRLTSRLDDRGVALSVEDEGAGIANEHLPHVFDRFYKADASRAGVSGGSGLGLSIVKAIVERHGGQVSVTSRPGRTVFEVTGLGVPSGRG